jgi:uncharacterized protein YhbP (UPF0306 family)
MTTAAEELESKVQGLISKCTTASLATVTADGAPRIATVFFVSDPQEPTKLIFKSRAGSDHMLNLRSDTRAAMSLYVHSSTYAVKTGIQFVGRVRRIEDVATMTRYVDLYSDRFSGARERFLPVEELVGRDVDSTLFVFEFDSYKLTDAETGRADHSYQVAPGR